MREGELKSSGNAARQRLCGHRRNDDWSDDPGAVTLAAYLARAFCRTVTFTSMKLLGYDLPHAIHPLAGPRTDLLVIGKIILDALAWQVGTKWLAPALLAFWSFRPRQSHVGKIADTRVVLTTSQRVRRSARPTGCVVTGDQAI
jgi:hypothetical protein